MSLAEMQSFLARLYVDGPFLKLFSIDPAVALEHYHLNKEERDAVTRLDPKLISMFSDSLRLKRKKRFDQVYPHCFKIGGQTANRYYNRFCDLRRFKSNETFLEQALDLGEFLEESFATEASLPNFLTSLAKYEKIFFLTRWNATKHIKNISQQEDPTYEFISSSQLRLGEGVHIAEFPIRLKALIKAIDSTEDPSGQSGLFYYVFCPAPRVGAKTLEVTYGSYVLLSLIDGKRNLADLVHDVQVQFDQEGLEGEIISNVRKLAKSGAVQIQPKTKSNF